VSDYFEKTPHKANRWFRAFMVLALVYGITFSLNSIFNWIFFLGAGYSLFMSYFTLPVQPKIFQRQSQSFNSGARATYGSAGSSAPQADRNKKVMAIAISIAGFFFFLIMVGIFSGNDQDESSSESTESTGVSPETSDESAANLTNTGMDLYTQEKYDESDGYFDRALVLDPGYMEAIYGKGIVLYQKGNREEANTYFTRAYEGGYEYAWLSWVLADTYDKSGATTRAVELYKESVRLDSSYVDSYNRLAELVPEEREKYLELAQKFAAN
jgi:tetratricopeptide (TPR) repeat protein